MTQPLARAAVTDPVVDAGATGESPAVALVAALALAVAAVAAMQTLSIPLLAVLAPAFDTSLAAVSWVATAALVSGAALNPIIGRAGDIIGKRVLLVACLGVSAAGCVVSALADSLAVVVGGRAIQGLGAGVIPLSYGIIRDRLAPGHVGRAVAAITIAGAGAGAGLGPVVAGAVIAGAGWRALFALAGSLLALAAVAVLGATRGGREPRSHARFDVPGAIVLAVALTVLLLAITQGPSWGWASVPTLALLTAAVAMVAWWLRWERHRADPMVDLALNRRPTVLLAHLGGVMVGGATFAQYIWTVTVVTVPTESGYGLGRSVAVAGVVQLPGAVVVTLAVVVAARVGGRHGAVPLLRTGAALIVLGFALGAVRHGELLDVVVSIAVVSAGLGLGHCALPLLLLDRVGPASTAAVNAVNALARVIGSVVASALVTSVMATATVGDGAATWPAAWTILPAVAIGALPAIATALLAGRLRGP